MATEQQTAVTKAQLDESLDKNFEAMRGYVDTAVDTLTEEMDRQFKALNTKLDTKFAAVIQSIKSLETLIKEHSHG